MASQVSIFAGRTSLDLGKKIAKSFGTEMGKISLTTFSDGEFSPSFDDTIRGNQVFIIQSTPSPQDNLMELLLMIDAAKRASAEHVIAVIPYYGLARQDRKDKPRVAIGAKLVANMLAAAGADRVITMDLHADQIQGFFNCPVDHLFASSVIIPYLKRLKLDNLAIASPDVGGSKRAAAYSKFLNTEMVVCYKQRKAANEIGTMALIGEVKDKNVIILDDIIDTAGTICKAADIMMANGARSVRAACTHAVLSGPAYDRLNKSCINEIITTDTLISDRSKCDKITILSTANLFAEVIKNVVNYESISTIFVNDK